MTVTITARPRAKATPGAATAPRHRWRAWASPAVFDPWAARAIPWFAGAALLFAALGVWVGFAVAPADRQQGEVYRLIFLLTVEEHATVDLKTVHQVIGAASRVSFGKPEKLMEYLGVIPGAVTAFGAINDTGGNVKVILDEELMKFDIVNCHPLSNDATTSIASRDLLRFMEATGHEPLVLKVTA